MTAINHPDLVAHQHEVQRLLGRCLLRLQQCERLLKAIVSARSPSGTLEPLPRAIEAEMAKTDVKTLGQLVSLLMGDYITREHATDPEVSKF